MFAKFYESIHEYSIYFNHLQSYYKTEIELSVRQAKFK